MKAMKNVIPVFTSAALLLSSATGTNAAAPDHVVDRETVYTLLNSDGTVKKSIVVDWLFFKGNGHVTVTDHGQLNNIRNVSGLEKPVVQNREIIWNVEDVKGERSIYYSGETNQPLPVDVSINYYLNGKKVDASTLAGKNGTVKIEMKLKNRLKQKKSISFADFKGAKHPVEKELYTPILSLVSLNIPTEHFTDIKVGDAMTVMSGKTMNATWMVVPNPEETIILEMKGTDIELEPITITLIPKLPPVPEMPVKEQLEKLTEGVQQISSALDQLGDGANQLAAGNRQVKSGLHQLSEGLGQLNQVNQAHVGLVKQSIDTNRQFLTMAQNLAAKNPQDANLQALIQGLEGQQQMLTMLVEGGNLQGKPFPGLNKMEEGIKGSKVGAEKLAAAADQLENGALNLKTGITKLSGGTVEMKNGLITGLNKLYEGEAVLNQSKTAAEQYDTFLGKPKGAKGEVRFILKTDPIKSVQVKSPAEQKPSTDNKEESISFFEKIKKFFTNLL
jgi:X-X-X-Leu-X-X-Gly heptad repeat protein